MTVAIPEAGTVARRPDRRPARQTRPTPAQMGRTGPPGPRGSTGRPGPVAVRGPGRVDRPRPYEGAKFDRRQTPRKQARARPPRRPNEFARRVTGAATRPGSELHNYQAIIAAEFVAASLLVALTPIASNKPAPGPSGGSPSPYSPGDVIQLVAVGIVYLILEGMAAGPRGLARFSAWFGFLILLGVGLYEASRLAALFKMLAGGDFNPIKLTGAQAPATKGESPIPPMSAGTPPPTAPPPPGG